MYAAFKRILKIALQGKHSFPICKERTHFLYGTNLLVLDQEVRFSQLEIYHAFLPEMIQCYLHSVRKIINSVINPLLNPNRSMIIYVLFISSILFPFKNELWVKELTEQSFKKRGTSSATTSFSQQIIKSKITKYFNFQHCFTEIY